MVGADWTISKLRWPVWNRRHAEGRGHWVACHGAGGPSATWPTISSSSTWPNAETRLVRYNLLHPGQPRRAAFTVVPSAVFADPQVASAGATEQDLQAQGRDYAAGTRPYSDTTYGWALEDTGSFVKILADPATRLLLGAHLLGPQAATLIQPLVQAMYLGSTVDQVASGVLYIHPALTEVVEQALLDLYSSGGPPAGVLAVPGSRDDPPRPGVPRLPGQPPQCQVLQRSAGRAPVHRRGDRARRHLAVRRADAAIAVYQHILRRERGCVAGCAKQRRGPTGADVPNLAYALVSGSA
jgi:Pyridine nucleotide-disulphide oxidoreductase, dimerisation domain